MTASWLPDLLRARAEDDPDAVALRVGDGDGDGDGDVLTQGRWDARSNAVARGLAARGVQVGDRVALAFPNDRLTDYAVSYLGVLKAGAVAVPLGARFSGPELDRVLQHSGATLLVDDVAVLESGRSDTALELRATGGLAEILYTSGTTGLPKGVACTHADLMAHDVPADAATGGGQVSFLHAFPIGTQAGQESLRVPLRIAGRTAIALPSFDPDAMCALVARHGVVRLQLVPAMAQLLVASRAYRAYDVSSVRRVILSSAPAAPALFARLAEAFPEATVWNAYALTEAGGARTMMQWDPARPTAVGQPVGRTEIQVVDESGAPVPSGATGEILLRRPGAPTRWYFDDPDATAVTFAGGWVHTGDLGHLDPDGFLHLTDRKKDVIITGGANVSSVEVEHALHSHPAVVEAAVVGVPHPTLGEDVAAVVVLRSSVGARELQDVVRARLAEHKVPHRVVVVDRLPRNPSGKVVKADVRALLVRPEPPGTFAPRTATEAAVASVWQAVLGVPEVGVDDDFYALGGHSLAAAQIAARLRDAFAVDLPVVAVLERPTVAELALVVDRLTAARAGELRQAH